GPKDVRSLAVQLKLLSLYESLYRTWSNATHGEGALKRLGGPTNDGLVQFDPIRSPLDLPDKCVHACNLTNSLWLTVVDKLVTQLRESTKRWYVENMQPAMVLIFNTKIR